jgi:hypothetical protein
MNNRRSECQINSYFYNRFEFYQKLHSRFAFHCGIADGNRPK